MIEEYINLTLDNLGNEHLCCAIADKKHQEGVASKKSLLEARLPEGHVFRKLNAKGKVFIEYGPLETAWIPVDGNNYIYIYCFWVAGSFKGKGHGKNLLDYCIEDARQQGKSGVCVLSSKKKKPFLSDPKFLKGFGFETIDSIDDYELMVLNFDGAGTNHAETNKPRFTDGARCGTIESNDLTVYYSSQCPYTNNCIEQIKGLSENNGIKLNLIKVDTLEKAKNVPAIFNNWAVFKDGRFLTNHLMNEGYFKKMVLEQK
jgi:ribosomal protein S18 acetylase RimI-like enzyme